MMMDTHAAVASYKLFPVRVCFVHLEARSSYAERSEHTLGRTDQRVHDSCTLGIRKHLWYTQEIQERLWLTKVHLHAS